MTVPENLKKGKFYKAVISWPCHLLPQCCILKFKRASVDNLKKVFQSPCRQKLSYRCQRFHYKESCGSSWNQTLLQVLLKWMKSALLKFAEAAKKLWALKTSVVYQLSQNQALHGWGGRAFLIQIHSSGAQRRGMLILVHRMNVCGSTWELMVGRILTPGMCL